MRLHILNLQNQNIGHKSKKQSYNMQTEVPTGTS